MEAKVIKFPSIRFLLEAEDDADKGQKTKKTLPWEGDVDSGKADSKAAQQVVGKTPPGKVVILDKDGKLRKVNANSPAATKFMADPKNVEKLEKALEAAGVPKKKSAEIISLADVAKKVKQQKSGEPAAKEEPPKEEKPKETPKQLDLSLAGAVADARKEATKEAPKKKPAAKKPKAAKKEQPKEKPKATAPKVAPKQEPRKVDIDPQVDRDVEDRVKDITTPKAPKPAPAKSPAKAGKGYDPIPRFERPKESPPKIPLPKLPKFDKQKQTNKGSRETQQQFVSRTGLPSLAAMGAGQDKPPPVPQKKQRFADRAKDKASSIGTSIKSAMPKRQQRSGIDTDKTARDVADTYKKLKSGEINPATAKQQMQQKSQSQVQQTGSTAATFDFKNAYKETLEASRDIEARDKRAKDIAKKTKDKLIKKVGVNAQYTKDLDALTLAAVAGQMGKDPVDELESTYRDDVLGVLGSEE